MAAYVFDFQGKQFSPNGRVEVGSVEKHNKQLEAKEIERLKQHPEKLFLYVKYQGILAHVTTWLGTVVSDAFELGSKAYTGFGMHTYRRSVDCRIFGVRYVGWYMESSGNYCRLRKAKQQ